MTYCTKEIPALKTYESIWHNPETGIDIIVARGDSPEYVKGIAQFSQFVPYTIREFQTKENIQEMYRMWRKAHNNKKPNRVIVKMHWNDESPEDFKVDTIAIKQGGVDISNLPKDDAVILFYCSSLNELLQLTKPNTGADFVVDEVLEFYKK